MPGLTRRRTLSPAQALLLAMARGEPLGEDGLDPNEFAGAGLRGDREALWTSALGLARHHGIAPLLHEQAQAGRLPGLPDWARKELRASRIAELAREEKRARVLRDALAVLEGIPGARPIPTVLLKGAASARTLYSAPELRPRSDLDLLIAPTDRAAALERFRASGYAQHEKTVGTREDEPDWHERTLVDPRDPSQQIDVHFALAQPQRHRLDAAALFAASLPDVAEPALGKAARILTPEHAALVCAHSIAIHELSAPLVSLCDLARLLPRCDARRLAQRAREVRLSRALYVSVALLARLGAGADLVLCGAKVEAAQLAVLQSGAGLPRVVASALRAVADAYDLERAPLSRPAQLWRKAILIDRPQDAARFAAAHALQGVRRAVWPRR